MMQLTQKEVLEMKEKMQQEINWIRNYLKSLTKLENHSKKDLVLHLEFLDYKLETINAFLAIKEGVQPIPNPLSKVEKEESNEIEDTHGMKKIIKSFFQIRKTS